MVRRLLTAFGVALLGLALLAPPAAAETLVVQDPAGDGRGLGDIRALRLSQVGSQVLVQVRTARGVDIDTAPTWNTAASGTLLRFNFDTNADGLIDWAALLDAAEGGPQLTLMGIAQSPGRRAPVPCATVRQPEPTLIRVKVQLSCLGQPPNVRAFARYWFDAGGDGSVESIDRVRNAGWTGALPIFN